MFKINKLPESIEKAISKAPLLIGLGPTAWPRIINLYYFPKFRMLVSNDSQDNEFIRQEGFSVYSQKQVDKYVKIAPITPGNIVTTDLAKKYLSKIKEPFKFVVYKSMGKFEDICKENGWEFVGNKREIRDKFENKKYFKELLRELGVRTIPGDNYKIEDLNFGVIKDYFKKYDCQKIVLQIAEATWGGGTGTFFIRSEYDYNIYQKRTVELFEKLKDTEKHIQTVNVAPFIEGISSSVPCCATKFGTLVGSIQTQLVDVPEVGAKLDSRSGVYSGHDWVVNEFSEKSQNQANEIAKKFGDFIYKEGYKGIFGLDLIVDKNGEVWPVECNPRETDAFPVILMLQMEKGAIPFQVFHNLEHLNIPYEIDFDEINKSYKSKYFASQLILFNKSIKTAVDRKVIKAGVYKLNGENIEFIREGFATWHLENEGEFLITEDVNKFVGNVYDPHERVLRFVCRGQMVDKEGNVLANRVKAISKVYEKLGLVEVDLGQHKEHGLDILTAKRIKNVRKVEDLTSKVDMINALIDQGEGVRRPLKIAWRMKLDANKSAIDQIKSKKTREQIKYDLGKIDDLNIKIDIVKDLGQKEYENWLVLYTNFLNDKFNTAPNIGINWLSEKQAKKVKVGVVMAYCDGKLIGGEIFTESTNKLSIGYGFSERFEKLRGDLMLLMDYKFIEYALELKMPEISFGQDINLYGTDLSAGLIMYKSKIGFSPVPANKTIWVNTFIVNSENIKKDLMFFAGDGTTTDSLVVIKTGNTEVDYSAYQPQNIKNIKVLDITEVIEKDRSLLIKNNDQKNHK
ncbi:MAG: ATP-grasp domain-containing protein [Patescibacteria group bacterium]